MSHHEPLGKNLSVKKRKMFDITYIIFIFANISSTRSLPENSPIMSPKSGIFAHHEPSRRLMMAHDVQSPKHRLCCDAHDARDAWQRLLRMPSFQKISFFNLHRVPLSLYIERKPYGMERREEAVPLGKPKE